MVCKHMCACVWHERYLCFSVYETCVVGGICMCVMYVCVYGI